jgi:hypothetical protein
MRRQQPDDWGTAIGSDPDKVSDTPKKKPRQDSLTGLINYFRDLLPRDAWGSLNSPVNAPAMMNGLKKLQSAGHTPEDIRGMMQVFVVGMSRKPLPVGVAPWRAFLANLDSLSNQVTSTENTSYDDLEDDRRL